MKRPTAERAESLLSHVDWVRALARRMVADGHLAEDLAQDACVAALERPPAACGSALRAWLAGVLRNKKRLAARGGARREARERSASRPEATPSTLELVERATTHKELIAALLEMEEPYREALLLRFYEELSQRQIAHRLGIPPSTAGSRVARGVERMRERLGARRRTDGRTWLAALLPWARRPSPHGPAPAWTTAITAGALVVSTQAKLAIALTALIGTAAILSTLRGAGSEAGEPAAASRPPRDAPAVLVAAAETPRSERRTLNPVPEVAESIDAELVRSEPARRIVGSVIDLEGDPVRNVRVRFRPTSLLEGESVSEVDELATTDVAGRFELAAADRTGRVTVHEDRYVTVLEGVVSSREGEHDVVVGASRKTEFGGVVVNDEGSPVAGAEVGIEVSPKAIRELGLILDRSLVRRRTVVTDELGRFSFVDAPGTSRASIVVNAPGYTFYTDDPVDTHRGFVRIVLVRAGAERDTVSGRVVDREGRPVEGASVSGGLFTVKTDANGDFTLEDMDGGWGVTDPDKGRIDHLLAVKSGYLPARHEFPRDPVSGEVVFDSYLLLEMSGPPMSLGGQVLLEDGAPLAGAEVYVLDPTSLGMVPAESGRYFHQSTVESLLGGEHGATTDSDGRFAIEGLADRDYHLEVLERQTLRLVQTGAYAAGRTDVEIVFVFGGLHARVAGRVLSPGGEPVGGVLVSAARDTRRFGDDDPSFTMSTASSATTGEDGRFELKDVAVDDLYIQLGGPSVLPRWRNEIREGADVEDLELTIERRCHFQVEISEGLKPPVSAEMQVLDAFDRPVQLMRFAGNVSFASETAQVQVGVSEVYAVGELAATAVFEWPDREPQRVPLELVPGVVVAIHP